MKERNYIIHRPDPESTLGLAVSDSIEIAKKKNTKVIMHLRGTACVITKDTRLEDAVSRFRRTAERFARVRN